MLHLDRDARLRVFRLHNARSGAAAVWADAVGLVVCGGNRSAPALELLSPEASVFAVPEYPADPADGAGLVPSAARRILRAGGRDSAGAFIPAVEYDLDCHTGCAAVALDVTVELDSVSGFGDSQKRALFVGLDRDGEIGVVALKQGKLSNVPLQIPRTAGAVVHEAPTGHLTILGGDSTAQSPGVVELLLP